MAVVGTASEVPGTRSSDYNGGIRTCSRTHLVKTDTKTDNESVVAGATGLPLYAAAHLAFSGAYAVSQSITEVGESGGLGWHVTTGYTSARELNENPADDEVLIDWNSEIYQEDVQFDIDSKAVCNSAGDYFIDPTPTREAIHLIARIQANVTSVPVWVITMQNAVNNALVTIGGLPCAAGLVRLQRFVIGQRQNRDGAIFYPFTFEAHIHKDGWRLRPLDAGFRELEYGELVQVRNTGDGEEVTSPAPLDGAGKALANPSPATGVFGNFQIYPEMDLTVFPGIE